MKKANYSKIIAVAMAAALSLAVFSGCTARNRNNTAGVASSVPAVNPEMPVTPAPDVDAGRLESEIERGVSELEENFGLDVSEPEREAEDLVSENEAYLDRSMPEISEYEASGLESVPTMSADFSQIGALSGQKDTGFPGGPVDELNRPSGPMTYQKKYGQYNAQFIIPDSKKIYLTFDEGYENGYTSRILDILKEKGVKAVFFITYPYAKSEPELVKRMINEGHTLGNHSTKHLVFPDMPLKEAAEDLMNLHDYVVANFGYEMWLFRPPEGAFSEQTLALAQQLGYHTMLWSFAYKDYDVKNQPLAIEAQDTIVKKLHPGEICLLHAVSRTNAEILGQVIDAAQAKGFVFADYFYFQ